VAEAVPNPALQRKLGLRDVTLFAVACIVGTRWIPAAAHAGPDSVTLWLAATLLFAVPLAIAVGALSVKYPHAAADLYGWTRDDFGRWHGFLCFWVYWMGIAFLLPTAALFYMGAGFYAMGPRYAHLADNRFCLLAAALVAIWVALGATLLVLAVLVGARRGSATPIHLLPRWNWDTVSFWSNIAYGMTGLEMAAMMGAEIRDPARTLPRAGWIASGFATMFYSAATLALLVLLRPENISELNGLAQAGESAASVRRSRACPLPPAWTTCCRAPSRGYTCASAGRALGAMWLPPLLAVLVMASAVGQWGTPHVSILTFGVVASAWLVYRRATRR
jgi:amino acid transporter